MRCSRGRSGTPPALIAPYLFALAVLLPLLLAACAASPSVVSPPEVPENPAALDAWLSARESAVPGLIPGDEKRIEWAGAPGVATEYAISYLHGFQGSPREYAAVIHAVAARLGANVFYQRLKGHGVTTDEIADATRDDWLADAREALDIGSRVGGRVILAGSSMGGDLALWLAVRARPEPAALVLFSCAVEPREKRADLLLWSWPFPQIFVGVLIGRYWHGGFDSADYPTGDAALWARLYPPRYRSESFITFMDVVSLVRRLPLEQVSAPSLWLFSRRDNAVDIPAMRRAFLRMGGEPRHMVEVQGAHAHMLAGDIFSPETSGPVNAEILSFLAECGILAP